jgi:hypothetical protein
MTRRPAAFRKMLIGVMTVLYLALPIRQPAMAECGAPAVPCAAISPAATDQGALHHNAPDHRQHHSLAMACCGGGACVVALLPTRERIVETPSPTGLYPAASDALLQGIAGAGIDHPPRHTRARS